MEVMCPPKKGRRGLRDGRPLGDLAENNNDSDNDEAANSSNEEDDSSNEEAVSSGSEDDASSHDDPIEEVNGGFAPPLDLKADARLDSLRRDNMVLREIVRRQDQVLEEMAERTRQIQAATA